MLEAATNDALAGDTIEGHRTITCTGVTLTHLVVPEGRAATILEGVVSVECRVSGELIIWKLRTGHWTLIGMGELVVNLLCSFCHCASSTVCRWIRREEEAD